MTLHCYPKLSQNTWVMWYEPADRFRPKAKANSQAVELKERGTRPDAFDSFVDYIFGLEGKSEPNASEPSCKSGSRDHYSRAVRYGTEAEFDRSITRLGVMELSAWACGICGEPIDSSLIRTTTEQPPGYGTIDHIVPMSKGGPHTWGNVQAAHSRCNSSKGNRTNGS